MIELTGSQLGFSEIENIIFNHEPITLAKEARESVVHSREFIDKTIQEGRVIYGVTTGFGKFSDKIISKENTKQLQENLIMSHAVGVGEPFNKAVVRGIMLFRINNLIKGYSGIRLETVQLLVEMLNKGVHPVIPSQGSVGSSGDLAPLAHMVLVMLGRGKAHYNGKILQGDEALESAGLSPIQLQAKEGLALINGTQAMASVGANIWLRMRNLLKTADICGAMTVDALEGLLDPFDHRFFQLRAHPGHGKTSANLRCLLESSEIIENRTHPRVQDAYTVRCIPQVHGTSKDAHSHVGEVLEREINSTTDNPLVFADTDEIISGGNFHGQPLAIPMDYLAVAISELGNISERRVERLMDQSTNYGLPAFLIQDGGISSGFMILQYTAASLVSENKSMAHPASVDSIPTSSNQEDHVSMGTTAARKAMYILENCEKILAIEIMCAAQGLEFRSSKKPGRGTKAALDRVRQEISFLEQDRELEHDLKKAISMVKEGEIVKAVEKEVGPLAV